MTFTLRLIQNQSPRLVRSLALIPLTLSLLGCGGAAPLETSLSDERPPTLRALEPQRFDRDTLTEGVIEVVVPAGEWRILFGETLDPVHLQIASLPGAGAEPYVGIGSGPEDAQMTFIAVPEGEPWLTEVFGFMRSVGPTGDERALLLGSNEAETRFLIGYLGDNQALTLQQVLLAGADDTPEAAPAMAARAAALDARPRVAARFESGSEGFAGTVMRFRLQDGSLFGYEAGRLRLEDLSLLNPAAGLHVLGHYQAQVDEMALRPGVGSSQALAVLHSGQVDYDLRYAFAPFERQQVGGGVGVGASPGGFVLPTSNPEFLLNLVDTGLPDLGLSNILLHFYWTTVDPGPLQLNLDYRFNGRQGEAISPVGNPEAPLLLLTPDIFWLSFGYAAADLEALYGWQLDRNFGI
jgi:hypothetical protein